VHAARHHGVISMAELRQFGQTEEAIRWKVEAGLLEMLFVGVFRVAGSPDTWEQRLLAAVRWGGHGAVASYRSAAALWGFDGFGWGPLEISTVKQNRQKLGFRVHRTLVGPAFVTEKLRIPVTSAHRTVRDMVTVLDDDHGNQFFDEGLRKGLISMDSCQRYVEREQGSGRRGVGVLRRLVEERSPEYQPSASEFQALVGRLLSGAGIPFIEEYNVYDAEGRLVGRADFKLLDCPVVVEAEGQTNHSSKIDYERDLKRRNAFTAAGLAMVHVTWDMARSHAEAFLDEVRRVRDDQLRRLA
jgi:hypothetical protein